MLLVKVAKYIGARVYRRPYLLWSLVLADSDQRGFYKHRESRVGLEGTKARGEHVIRNEDATLLRDKVRISERWSEFYHML